MVFLVLKVGLRYTHACINTVYIITSEIEIVYLRIVDTLAHDFGIFQLGTYNL